MALTLCTLITFAPRRTLSTAAATLAVSRFCGSVSPIIAPKTLLRDTPIKYGRFSGSHLSGFASKDKLCSTVLPKPMPGSNSRRFLAIPFATHSLIRCCKKDFTSPHTLSYCGLCCIFSGSPCMCIKQMPVFAYCDSNLTAPVSVKAAISLIISTTLFSNAFFIVSVWRVSKEIGTCHVAISCKTGKTLCHSSSEDKGCAFGRVDSPPISKISAPSLTSCSACFKAA